MRAKFQCASVTDFGTFEEVNLNAVYAGDKNAEDNQFSLASPSGSFKMCISNPAARGFFKPNKKYYFDFTEAAE